MLAKYIQKGECIDYTPEAAVAAGDVVVQGALTGVAKLDIEAGKLGALALHGLYDVAKGANAIAAGAQLYWDAANKVATTTSTSNTALGKAAAAGVTDLRLIELFLSRWNALPDSPRKQELHAEYQRMLEAFQPDNPRGMESANFAIPPETYDAFQAKLRELVGRTADP